MCVVGYKPTSKNMSDQDAQAHLNTASFFFNPTDGRRGMRSLEFPVKSSLFPLNAPLAISN